MNTPVVKRIPRERIEDCDRCCGSGKVERKEFFALWTPDEFDHVRPLDPKHDAPADAYVCTAAPGGMIREACDEAVTIAKIVERPVAFVFNGVLVVIRATDDPIAQMKKWWIRAYGKTYEESMNER